MDVGKIVSGETGDRSGAPRYAGWRDQETHEWISGQALYQVVERWQIIHRGHEVRLLSESYLNAVDPEGSLHYIDSAEEILSIVPIPDDEEDAQEVPESVAISLKRVASTSSSS